MTNQRPNLATLMIKSADPFGDIESRMNRDVMAQSLKTLLLGGAIGAGARGVIGLPYMFGSGGNISPAVSAPKVVEIPRPVYTRPKEKQKSLQLAKTANQTYYDGPKSRQQVLWYWPALIGSSILGTMGGYNLMDKMLDKKRKEDLATEVDAAKLDYRNALLSQYNPSRVPLEENLPEFYKSVDVQNKMSSVADKAEKKAFLREGLGAYLGLASLLAGSAGMLAYKTTKDRSTTELLRKAIEMRERERWASKPPEVYALPRPVHITKKDELEEQPTALPESLA